MKIPAFVLRKLYVKGSLRADGVAMRFTLRNGMATASLTQLKSLRVDNRDVPAARVRVRLGGREVDLQHVSAEAPLVFGRGEDAEVRVDGPVAPGKAHVKLVAQSAEFGELVIEFEDDVAV